MIKTGGINVAPVEVEESLLRHPAVKLAFVTGVSGCAARRGDRRRDRASRRRARGRGRALTAHCRRELAAYKVPRLITFVNEADLPLTVTGKLQKNRLHEFFTRAEPTRERMIDVDLRGQHQRRARRGAALARG